MNYLGLIAEIEGRIDKAIKEGKTHVIEELKDLLQWVKANC